METYALDNIYSLDFELTMIFAQKQKWIDGVLFRLEKPRKSSAFIYLNGCTGQYTDLNTGKSFHAPVKSFVYLPYQGRYTVLNIESEKADVDAFLVEFNVVLNGKTITLADAPQLLENCNHYYLEKMMNEIVNSYESIERSPSLLKSKIYALLAYVSNSINKGKENPYRILEPAMEYIEKTPFHLCSVETMARICGLSGGGFRRLFRQCMGKSPKEYILDIQIKNARNLLEESDMTVRQISEVLNFDTSAYFCRFFKKRTGCSPSEYRAFCKSTR